MGRSLHCPRDAMGVPNLTKQPDNEMIQAISSVNIPKRPLPFASRWDISKCSRRREKFFWVPKLTEKGSYTNLPVWNFTVFKGVEPLLFNNLDTQSFVFRDLSMESNRKYTEACFLVNGNLQFKNAFSPDQKGA